MRNWTIKDAVATIQNGKDTEAIKEIAKHFPLFFMAVAKNDLGAVAAMMTDKMTVRRLQMECDGDDDTDTDTDTDDGDVDDGTQDTTSDLESMSTKELIALCGKRGIKVPKYGKNKQFYLDALQGGGDADSDGDVDEDENDPYEGKNAMQLYSMCKKRGIKVAPKQKAAVYLKALKAADAEAESTEDADADDWGDDDDADEKPKKGSNKKASKTAKKDVDDDDDDDWEL